MAVVSARVPSDVPVRRGAPRGPDVGPPGGVRERIAADLRGAILGGNLAPGAKLPSERQLAARYGTGRTTVREALGLLRDEGLVAPEHGRGVFVRQPPRLLRPVRAEADGCCAPLPPPVERAADRAALTPDVRHGCSPARCRPSTPDDAAPAAQVTGAPHPLVPGAGVGWRTGAAGASGAPPGSAVPRGGSRTDSAASARSEHRADGRKPVPPPVVPAAARPGQGVAEAAGERAEALGGGVLAAPEWVADRLGVPVGSALLTCRHRVWRDGAPVEITDTYVAFGGAEAGVPSDTTGPTAACGVPHACDRGTAGPVRSATEEVAARMPMPQEREALAMARGVPVLEVVRVGSDADAVPTNLVHRLLPADRHLLSYQLTIS